MIYINSNKLQTLDINKYNTYIISDFDKTITSDNSLDSWAIAGNLLSDKFKDEMQKLYEKYINNTLDAKIKKRCCNFKLLEQKCKEYNKS